jgi:hypothetical protein
MQIRHLEVTASLADDFEIRLCNVCVESLRKRSLA